jgi:DNA-binding response OmpR family regulator
MTMPDKARILIVDDDPDFVETTKLVLESASYEVLVARDGAKGLETAKARKPDLVLLDIIMPVKDGLDTAEQFKKDPELKQIPVLMLTSFSSKSPGTSIARGRGLKLEAEDYIEKPVSPEELLAKVKSYLSQ